MFKKHIALFTLVWLVVLGIGMWTLFTPTPEDKEAYVALVHGNPAKNAAELEKEHSPIQQVRESIHKQILYTKNECRQQTRLKSAISELVFKTEGNQTECTEDFQNMVCQTQDVSGKMGTSSKQDFRCFEAKNAVYSYKSGILDASKVFIRHYEFPSTVWPENSDAAQCVMQGSAQDVQLSLMRDPIIKAQEFRAIFYSPEEND